MLPNKRNDLLYLLNILEYIGKIWKYTEEVNNAEDLFELNEQLNLNASLTLLANIGENVSKLSDTIKQEYSTIEWQQMKNFRNRIVHDYVGIDLAIVYEIITNDLKTIKTEIEKKIKESLTKIVAILDRSGSMESLTNDTGGYNSFIKEQKAVPGEAILTTVLFDDQYELLHDRIDIKKWISVYLILICAAKKQWRFYEK